MGAPIIGRTNCPECGFESAHVKRSERCTFRYCPECGSQHHARSARQVADLMAKTRPVDGAAAPPTPSGPSGTPAPAPAAEAPPLPTGTATPTEPPAAAPAPRRRLGLF